MRFAELLAAGYVGQCQWVCEDFEQCGLIADHDGDHVPYVPGDYLPPPIIHPLDLARLPHDRRCPLCRERLHAAWFGPPTHAFRGEVANWGVTDIEYELRFWPCQCVMRQLAVDPKGSL